MKKQLNNYYKTCNELAEFFCIYYFENDDFYWVGDNIGELLEINDLYFNMNDIVNFLKYDYSVDELLKYYDYLVDQTNSKDIIINIKNYKKLYL